MEPRLYIAEEDMKARYQPLREKGAHVQSYLRSLQHSSRVAVDYELLKGNTAAFTIKTTPQGQPVGRERKKTIEYIQGEFCDPNARKKYESPVEKLPHQDVHHRQPTLEACVKKLTISNLEKHEMQDELGPYELRQFACSKCNYSWWRTVAKRKPVSRCRGKNCSGQRYDALPLDKEFGIGKYCCFNCDRLFYAHCEATLELPCRKCKRPCRKPIIHPKWRKNKRKEMPNPENGTRRFQGRGGERPPFPNYPEGEPEARAAVEQRKPAFNPSRRHESTGSTNSTCITQHDQISVHDLDYDDEVPDTEPYPRRYECDCGQKYTSRGKMTTGTSCYKCKRPNIPLGPSSAEHIQRTTDNRHSCDECTRDGKCPNLA